MKLQKIEIENFASYYGKHDPISLEVKPSKPLIIFIGGTGFGKTSLFDAINWALYGEEYEKDISLHKERQILDYVNEYALKEAYNANKRFQMSITLYFEHFGQQKKGYGIKEYYITQVVTLSADKIKGKLTPTIKDRHTHLREILHDGNHVEITYNRTFLDEILPNNVKSYFLFDGDRIHNLAKPGNSQEVRDAIYRVVDLEIIRNAAEHLNDAAIEFGRRSAKVATGELAEVETKYNDELEHQTSIRKRISEIRQERQAINDQLVQIDAKLKDLPASSALQERKSGLAKELQQTEQEKKETKNLIREKAAKAILGFAAAPLKDLKNLLHEKRTRGEIPKHVRETFFEDLFSIEECICGTKFQAKVGDKIFEKLKERLESEKNRSNEEDRLIDLYHELIQSETIINDAKNEVSSYDDVVLQLEEKQKNLLYEKQEIEKQLGELPIEDINKLIIERKTREESEKILFAELKTKEAQLTNSEQALKTLDNQRKDLGKKQQEAGAFHLRSELAKKASDELNSRYDIFAEQSREQVEKLTIEEFKQFVSSASNYKVALGADYALEVLDSNNNSALQRLSMGQSQCLSLAFITAISRVSRKHPPLVIDMPFSRLDPKVHHTISSRLPKLAEQIILFLIPEVEWNVTTKTNLASHANHIYEMQFDETIRQTSINNYY